jgi:hypothetical protein
MYKRLSLVNKNRPEPYPDTEWVADAARCAESIPPASAPGLQPSSGAQQFAFLFQFIQATCTI